VHKALARFLDGGAKVVGFDIVFPTSIEQRSANDPILRKLNASARAIVEIGQARSCRLGCGLVPGRAVVRPPCRALDAARWTAVDENRLASWLPVRWPPDG
jgi:hypothetical protein